MTIQRIDSTYRGKPTHHYKIDGVRADGVTTLIGNGLPKPALLPWGIKSVAEYAADHLDRLVEMQPMGREAIVAALKQSPYTDRDQAAKRGTEIHALAEDLLHGRQVDVPDEIAGHVDSCVRFLDEWQPKPILTETVVASRKWNYCGTLDLVAEMHGKIVVADWKSTRSGIFGETALQAAAYANAEVYVDAEGAEQTVESLGIEKGLGVWLRGDGFSVYELDISPATFNVFLHVSHIARKAKGLRDLVVQIDAPVVAS